MDSLSVKIEVCDSSSQTPQQEIKEWLDFLAFSHYGATGCRDLGWEKLDMAVDMPSSMPSGAMIGWTLERDVFEDLESRVQENHSEFEYYFDNKNEAELFCSEVSQNPFIQGEVVPVESMDWNQKWQESFQSIALKQCSFDIIPSWEKSELKISGRIPILIHPGQGFGTGHHETTQMCLAALEQYGTKRAPKTVWDFGCGSGILGIGAIKLFPDSQVDFCEIDSAALENLSTNLELNNISEGSLLEGSVSQKPRKSQKYDFIMANVLLDTLVEKCPELTEACLPNSILVLSGVLTSQVDELLGPYLGLFSMLELKKQNEWAAVILQKL